MRFFQSLILISFAATSPLLAENAWEDVTADYCLDCHDHAVQKGGVNIEALLDDSFPDVTNGWEEVLRQMQAQQMPPVGKRRPSAQEYSAAVSDLSQALDRRAAQTANPGRTDTLRRLTRFEYQNAIRDLLHLEVDASELLPADESSHGFDNITVGTLSPGLLERYISAAQKVSAMAIGSNQEVDVHTVRLPADLTQEDHVAGLPLGTRGGAVIRHHFPADGEYEVKIFLTRDRNELIEGMSATHEMQILLNRELKAAMELKPPKNNQEHTNYDDDLITRIRIEAGPQDLGVTFVKKPDSLVETLREPYEAHFNLHRHPRLSPAIYQVSISGPFDPEGPGDTPSRKRIFSPQPDSADEETEAAEQILGRLARLAWRRPIEGSDLSRPLALYHSARESGGGFETGIENALSAILVSRNFLFRVEADPRDVPPSTPYALSDLKLASRLSFFLWSSIPDEELLLAAEEGRLKSPAELQRQARRMLQDPRASALVENFADQWLYLRNLDSITPDGRLFPDFDDNLRDVFREETRRHFADMIQEDGSALDLLQSDDTWLNERLAKHYGIPHIHGPRFRKVSLPADAGRGGLLRHGSVLMVTSYATRTSPVIRGHWILENLLGTPPPPPPPNVPTLEETEIDPNLPIRERLALHREDAACASCHNVMDPIGFALENFDAVGQWRVRDNGLPVDSTGSMPSGAEFEGVAGLENYLLENPDAFVRTMTEKLLTYALGRGVESFDGPAVRKILRTAEADDYQFSTLIAALVTSEPFTLRMSAPAPTLSERSEP